jgi:hypothetical protein
MITRKGAAAGVAASAAGWRRPLLAAKERSRAHLDARICLKQATDRAVMACAEKYR